MRGFKEENNNGGLAAVPNNTDQDVKERAVPPSVTLFRFVA